MSLDFQLTDRVAIVTGAGKGIGKQIALAFSRSGADVVVCSRNLDTLKDTAAKIEAEGQRAMAIRTDIRSVAEIQALVRETLDKFGKIDILVNNAGINRTRPTLDVTEETWDAILETNLKGMFFACQAVGRHMIERRRGKIINIGSIVSKIGLGFNVPYCASKGGVWQLTKALALEWAPYNINVNAIGPGYVLTEQVRWSFEDPEMAARIRAKMPMRVGEVEDIEGTAVFLASEASDYINGQMIFVEGAQSIGWMGPE